MGLYDTVILVQPVVCPHCKFEIISTRHADRLQVNVIDAQSTIEIRWNGLPL